MATRIETDSLGSVPSGQAYWGAHRPGLGELHHQRDPVSRHRTYACLALRMRGAGQLGWIIVTAENSWIGTQLGHCWTPPCCLSEIQT